MAWRTAKSLIICRDQINQVAPNRSKASDGTIGDAAHASRKVGPQSWVKRRCDWRRHSYGHYKRSARGCDAQKLVDALVNSRDARIKYVIGNRRKISSQVSAMGVAGLHGTNPGHNKHSTSQ